MSEKKYIELGKIIDAIMSIPVPADSYFAQITDAGKELCVSVVQNVQTADVAPVVHGHWSKEMRFTEDFMGNRTYGYKCSVCGKLANRLQFCGNCGAKMDESEDNE